MSWKITTASVAEPLSLEEAKLQCRVTASDDDVLIARLVVAAREYVERFTRRALTTKTIQLRLLEFPIDSKPISLPRPPLISVTTLEYRDLDTGNYTALVEGTDFEVDEAAEPAEIHLAYLQQWPSARYVFDGARVTYQTGYGPDGEDVPGALASACGLLIANWYENREPTIAATIVRKVPFTIESLMLPYKIPEL